MFYFADPQDALDFYETDDTQWLVTDGTQYGVCDEADATHAVQVRGWSLTSPEELTSQIRN